MKFWQKAFLGILAAFIIFINVSLYLTSEYSFNLNLNRDTDRALGEYHIIINGAYETMNSIYYRDKKPPDDSAMESLMRSYADYYIKQGVYFELKHLDQRLYINIPADAAAVMTSGQMEEGAYAVKAVSGGGINYLSITGALGGQFQDYSLTYLRDMSELYTSHARLTSYLMTVSMIAEGLLALVLFVILRKLTQPIRMMQAATRKIAGGVYSERIHMRGRDEFNDLSENFNQMASSIQEKISELDKNAQDKQRLIDNLAHELRTPLTAIRGYAEYIQNANTNDESRLMAASVIIGETDRMKNLAFKLLDIALTKNNKPDIQEIRPFDQFLEQIKDISQKKLDEKNISLKIECMLDYLTADPVLLQSLLLNLTDNAANASDSGSKILISAYFEEVPVLEVRDFGCGMEEDQVALVCEPFYRADKARSRSSGGVGLGLTLCSDIVRLHGADLKISSMPGVGTVIRILFTTPLQLSEHSVIPGAV